MNIKTLQELDQTKLTPALLTRQILERQILVNMTKHEIEILKQQLKEVQDE